NTDLGIDTRYLLTPRAVLSLGDEFSTRNSTLIGVDGSISLDTLLGATVTSPVLGSASRYLADNLHSNLTYALGVRDQLIVTPIFTYERTDVANVPTSSYA